MSRDEFADYPEHARWALKLWRDRVAGDDLDAVEVIAIVEILEKHREILAGYVQNIHVREVYKTANGIRERDIRAEQMGRSYINICAAMVRGKFGMVPKQKVRFKGRDIDDVMLPEPVDERS
jgi:hypothetical protein